MTREEKIEAFAMRLDGKTYDEIGKRFGLTKQRIEQILNVSGKYMPYKKVIYPNLCRHIKEHYGSVPKFDDALGYAGRNPVLMHRRLRGEGVITISEVREILKLTGMTFEECFALADGATEFVSARKKTEKRKREAANE